MTHKALPALDQVIAALTYEEIEHLPVDGSEPIRDEQVPLLQRSIGLDLLQIEKAIGGKGTTLLSAIAASIDDALLAAEQARELLRQGNVKPAPFTLNEVSVGRVVAGKPGTGMEDVPFEGTIGEDAQYRLPTHPIPHVAGQPKPKEPKA